MHSISALIALVLAIGLTRGAVLNGTSTSTTTLIPPLNVTTAAPLNITSSSVNGTSGGNDTCKAQATCYEDSDCGEKGRCLGIFVGKCNCNACFNFLSCEEDSACGGLVGACNGTTSRCNCNEGYEQNGFPTFLDALRGLCNTKDCNADNANEECFGLPCHSGHCFC